MNSNDQDEEGNPIDVFGPNGIPDWAEFALIDALVQDPSVDFTAYSGVGGEFVKAAFEDNLAQAEIDLSGLDAAIQRTVAYYMTLCDIGSRNFAMDMVYNTWEVSLAEANYACSGSDYLASYGNTDNDGQFNIEEWEEAGYEVETYIDRTLDDERTPDESLLDPQGSEFVEDCTSCTKTTLNFVASGGDGGNIGGYSFVMMIDGEVVADDTEVALGRWIDIYAAPDLARGYQFDYWSAPGNLLNGDRSRRTRFMLMPPPSGNTLDIGPVFHRNRVKLPYDYLGVTYSIEMGDTVVDITSEVNPGTGFKEFAGHRGSTVTMSVDSIYNFDCGQHDPEHIQQHVGWNLAGLVTYTMGGSLEVLLPWERTTYSPGTVIHCDSLPFVAPENTRTITAASAQGIPAAIGPSNCAGAVGSVVLDADSYTSAMGTFWPQPGYELNTGDIEAAIEGQTQQNATVSDVDCASKSTIGCMPASWTLYSYSGSVTATAEGETVEQCILELKAVVIGGGPQPSSPPGYLWAEPYVAPWPIQKPRHYAFEEEVGINVQAHCGYVFTNRWTAGPCGSCWLPTPPGNAMFGIKMIHPKIVVTAEFEKVAGSIQTIEFTSDHDVLFDEANTFENDGSIIIPPEWDPTNSKNYPITHTMNSNVTAKVKLDISPASYAESFILRGRMGSTGIVFEGTGSGSSNEISVTTTTKLPNQIDIISESINWVIELCSGVEIDVGQTGPHKIFVTFGPNQCTDADSPWPGGPNIDYSDHRTTIKRLEFLCNAAKGKSLRLDVASVIAQALWNNHGDWGQAALGLWAALDSAKRFECEAGRHLGGCGMLMLGVPRTTIQQSSDQGCHGYPSTDTTSGTGYNSNCTDSESRPGFGNDWELILSGNGPRENFFKVKTEAGYWYYIAVAPFKGPFLGSGTQGDTQDLSGRYKIMDASPRYYQEWRLKASHSTLEPAPDLP